MNGHRDEDGHPRRHQQQTDELHRRNLQPPHGRGHSNSEEGPGLKGRSSHQQAVSLDHYNSKHSLLSAGPHFPYESSPPVSTGALPANSGMPSMSPSSATASVQYLQNYRQVGMGVPQGSSSRGPHPTSNSSSHSTPPFSFLDQQANVRTFIFSSFRFVTIHVGQQHVSRSDQGQSALCTVLHQPRIYFTCEHASIWLSDVARGGTHWQQTTVFLGSHDQCQYIRGGENCLFIVNQFTHISQTSWQQQVNHTASSPENISEELHLLMTLPRSPFLRLLSTGGDPKAFTEIPQSQTVGGDNNRLDVILYEEKKQQQQIHQLNGWGGGGVADNPSKYLFGDKGTSANKCPSGGRDVESGDCSDESSRQFRLSDDRRGSAALQLDFGDTTGSDADRTSLERAMENDDGGDDDDMMFAFALNPHEFASHSHTNEHTSPSVPSRLLMRRNSSRLSLISGDHTDLGEGQSFTAAVRIVLFLTCLA